MSRRKASLHVGEMLQGARGSLRVEGCLVFKERDQADRRYYHWEEWRLSGGVDDMWVELDHYDDTVYLYEPLPIAEPIDPQFLAAGQILTLTSAQTVYAARVIEVGVGTLVSTKGHPDYRLNTGEKMGYAELELTDAAGATTLMTMDTHGLRDLVSYTKVALNNSAQKRLFGKVIHRSATSGWSFLSSLPSSVRSAAVQALMWILVGLVVIPVVFACESEDEDDTGTGSGGGVYRPVYGGGGGGVGK